VSYYIAVKEDSTRPDKLVEDEAVTVSVTLILKVDRFNNNSLVT